MADNPAITDAANAILQAERTRRNMPAAGPNDSCCLAYTEVGGQRYFADNTTCIPYNWPTVGNGPGQVPQGQGLTRGREHAEVQSMLVAGAAAINGQAIVIFTDRQPCGMCDKGRAMENAARILGATSVTIWGPCGGIGPINL